MISNDEFAKPKKEFKINKTIPSPISSRKDAMIIKKIKIKNFNF